MYKKQPENHNVSNRNREDHERPIIPLPKETLEDRDVIAVAQAEIQRRVDDAYEEFVRSGGLERLPGIGKPLEVPTGDILSSILRQANVQPPWLVLLKEIRANMEAAMELMKKSPGDPEIDALLADTNKQIAELNHQAPSLTLHRKKVTRANLREQYECWYSP
ncbi:DUF1992 domain-containing protein [Paenibacillus naphthalenovorans]|uniref:Uncharacterized protein n=1 Tax=Paenibacillus naphthalenovorans TaxID=162209 RepID=A0A0U2UQE8_9BACL|nr:DUF1992 domain-containing protein [Paenibacillus naphthalenovorans]ALS24273.1 hypothetical protein IJ22_39610 [Paenibacillus naphthalenovorans]